ncbi:hypothetical protein NXX04_06725 [Bacteroides ovatus]|nr:hypothetical protein [Bacteroides ovatus]
MWREDNIIEEIVEDSNIEDAIKTVLRKRRRKRSFAGRRILADVPKAVERGSGSGSGVGGSSSEDIGK